MTDTLAPIFTQARAKKAHIVLPEGDDPRVVSGGLKAVREGYAKITFLGDEAKITEMVIAEGVKPEHVGIIDPATTDTHADYAKAYFELREKKGATQELAAKTMRTRLGYGAMMVRLGHADGSLAGATHTTSDTVRAALQIIGKAPDAKLVSSFFVMLLATGQTVVFGDCGLTIDPNAEELANIAASSADSFKALMDETPKIAMLSFSTKGSAKHERVNKVIEATAIVKRERTDLAVSGELQFDAAFVPEIAATKAPDAIMQGDANVFIFPNLDAGNIGYKIAQRIGGAQAIGPILQGLKSPANDLSRGCTAEDVALMIAVTAAQVRN